MRARMMRARYGYDVYKAVLPRWKPCRKRKNEKLNATTFLHLYYQLVEANSTDREWGGTN